jgi:transcriptional repressor NrdR
MFCPKCNSDRTSVTDSRSDGGAIRRRRECQACDYRFTTYERVEFSLPVLVKKDGRREPFDREKIRAGFRRACEKRPVSTETIDQAVEAIEKRMQEMCVKEVDSRLVGEAVMHELRNIDKIAYVRFASVYREFSDVEQFVDALQSLSAPVDRSDEKRLRRAVVIENTKLTNGVAQPSELHQISEPEAVALSQTKKIAGQ